MKNVKILSLFIILSIPFISLGQFTYNVSTGVFNYDYNPCTDPCVMANTEDCLKKANMRKLLKVLVAFSFLQSTIRPIGIIKRVYASSNLILSSPV